MKPLITKVCSLNNEALLRYLNEHCIDITYGKTYLKEIYYEVNSKKYFGVAFENIAGGYEVANTYGKYCISPKDITIINNGYDKYSIFDGFLDFLSSVSFYRKKIESDVLVLNSLKNLNRAMDYLSTKDIGKIWCFLGRDKAHQEAYQQIANKFNGIDCSYIYKGYKNFNEFLVAHCKKKI